LRFTKSSKTLLFLNFKFRVNWITKMLFSVMILLRKVKLLMNTGKSIQFRTLFKKIVHEGNFLTLLSQKSGFLKTQQNGFFSKLTTGKFRRKSEQANMGLLS